MDYTPEIVPNHLLQIPFSAQPPRLLTRLIMAGSRLWPFSRGLQRWRDVLRKTFKPTPATVLVPLRSSSVKVEVPWDDFCGINLIAYGENDHNLFRFLVHCMEHALTTSKSNEAPIFLDIGANLGAFALRIANRLPVRSVAFEPNPFLVSLLQRNIFRNKFKGSVDLRGVALGASPGTVHLHLSGHDSGNTKVGVATSDTCAVPQHILPQELSVDEWRRVAIIKMDVEGYESEILTGAASLFEQYLPPLVLEVNIDELAERGKTPEDMGHQLAKLGYSSFFALETVAYPISNGVYKVTNIIALPEAMKEISKTFGFSENFRPKPQPLWPVIYYSFYDQDVRG